MLPLGTGALLIHSLDYWWGEEERQRDWIGKALYDDRGLLKK
jgi:hypothetical protein